MMWILDNGHGGLDESGNYLTDNHNKRSPELPDGSVFYEGVWDRKVVSAVAAKLGDIGIEHHVLVPEEEDVPMSERLRRLEMFRKEDAFLLSVHMNGDSKCLQTVKSGHTTFYNRGNPGRRAAMTFQDSLGDRIGNRGIFEAGFSLISQRLVPALLLECGFMNNLDDVLFLRTDVGVDTVSDGIVEAIVLWDL